MGRIGAELFEQSSLVNRDVLKSKLTVLIELSVAEESNYLHVVKGNCGSGEGSFPALDRGR